ncbi:MAG: PKD domain-containing protein [Bacteroidota bacterium]|nr:PKD domain-containing protein [Bacteroidota bacterium]
MISPHVQLRSCIHVLAVLGIWLSGGAAYATHLVGGELTYSHLGGNTYEVTLTVFRDCGPANTLGTGFDDEVYIGMWSGSGAIGFNHVLTIPLVQSNVTDVPVILGNPCGTPPPELCIEQAIYSTTVDLPATNYGWDLVWQRCCRNPSISNLQNFGGSDNPGATFVAHIPGDIGIPNAFVNSSPTFLELPPVAVCANFEFTWDHSATDDDGDELVYSLCGPLDGGGTDGGGGYDSPIPNPPAAPPYQEVAYVGPYSGDYPIASDPAMAIDPVTGMITGTPTVPGQYAIGICVSEYRDGVLLSTTMRDFQFNVTLCDPNIQSVVAQQASEQLCIGETMTLTNNSINGSSYAWDFGVPGSTSDISDEFEPTYTWPEPGDYWVTLIVNPGWPCADTSEVLYQVWQPLEPEIVVSGFNCEEEDTYFDFEVNGNLNGDAQLLWTFDNGSPEVANTAAPGGIFFDNADTWEASVNVNNNGCSADATLVWEAPANPVAAVEDQYQFCGGLTLDFNNMSENAEAFYWNFGDGFNGGLSGTSTDVNPTYTFPDTGTYVITLTAEAPFTCPDVTTAEVEVQFLLEPTFNLPQPDCFDDHFYELTGTASVDENTIYEWDFGGITSLSTTEGPVVTGLLYAQPGTYEVTLTASVPGLEGCIQSYSDDLTVIAEPTIGFDAGPWSGCPAHTVSFSNLSTTETATTYVWDFGDGTTSTAANPNHIYEMPGTYVVSLNMETGGFCERSLSLTSDQVVEVHPTPDANLSIHPLEVDILNPQIWVGYAGDDEVDCYYNYGDGQGENGCQQSYTFSDGGTFTVTQTVINEFGCTDIAEADVAVSGSTFYAPNAFTPDGDGLNDVWIPIVSGVTAYELRITNRWGQTVFETTDPEEPWLGQFREDGQHYCPSGMYIFQVTYTDQIGYPREVRGHMFLIR